MGGGPHPHPRPLPRSRALGAGPRGPHEELPQRAWPRRAGQRGARVQAGPDRPQRGRRDGAIRGGRSRADPGGGRRDRARRRHPRLRASLRGGRRVGGHQGAAPGRARDDARVHHPRGERARVRRRHPVGRGGLRSRALAPAPRPGRRPARGSAGAARAPSSLRGRDPRSPPPRRVRASRSTAAVDGRALRRQARSRAPRLARPPVRPIRRAW